MNRFPSRRRQTDYVVCTESIPSVGCRVRCTVGDGRYAEGVVRTKTPSKFPRKKLPGDRDGVHGYRVLVEFGAGETRFFNAENVSVVYDRNAIRRT